jgi:hypothetical protein
MTVHAKSTGNNATKPTQAQTPYPHPLTAFTAAATVTFGRPGKRVLNPC